MNYRGWVKNCCGTTQASGSGTVHTRNCWEIRVAGGAVFGTVTDRSLRDAISLKNARFHGTTRRSFPMGRGDLVIKKVEKCTFIPKLFGDVAYAVEDKARSVRVLFAALARRYARKNKRSIKPHPCQLLL